MNPFEEFGKMLIILGIFILVIGFLLTLGGKIPYLGRLPGDIVIKRGNFTFYFPIVTCILLSVLLTLIFSLFRR